MKITKLFEMSLLIRHISYLMWSFIKRLSQEATQRRSQHYRPV